ncbi:MAG: hypothetical protein ACTS5I_02150, partial [Rhodanobacter sp.]
MFDTVVDALSDVGAHGSLQMHGDTPVLGYYDATNGDLKLATCTANCLEAAPVWQIVTVDAAGDVGEFASLALTGAGDPVLAYYDRSNGDLKLATCVALCTSAAPDWVITTVDSTSDVGMHTSLQLDSLDKPVISYLDLGTNTLTLATCLADCQAATPAWQIVTVDATAGTGYYSSLQLDGDDKPYIAYRDEINDAAKLARCHADCTTAAPGWWIETILDGFPGAGHSASLQLAADGTWVLVFFTYEQLRAVRCPTNCDAEFYSRNGASIDNSIDTGFFHAALTLNAGGVPLVSYLDYSSEESSTAVLKLATCAADCANFGAWQFVTLNDAGTAGHYSSLQVSSAGYPVIGHYDTDAAVLRFAARVPPPLVTSVTVPGGGEYVSGNELAFSVEFDAAVALTGTIALELTLDSGTVVATYQSGADTNVLHFSYTLQADDYDDDAGIDVAALVLDDGSTLQDSAGNDAVLALNAVGATGELLVNVVFHFAELVLLSEWGSVDFARGQDVPQGQSASFTLTADEGFDIAVSSDCGGSLNGNIFTTLPLAGSCTLYGTFISAQTLPFAEDIEYLSGGLPSLNAAVAYERGLSGQGVKVGIIDAGFYAGSVEFIGMNLNAYNFKYDTDDMLQ